MQVGTPVNIRVGFDSKGRHMVMEIKEQPEAHELDALFASGGKEIDKVQPRQSTVGHPRFVQSFRRQSSSSLRGLKLTAGCKKFKQFCISSTQYDASAYVHTIGIHVPITSPLGRCDHILLATQNLGYKLPIIF